MNVKHETQRQNIKTLLQNIFDCIYIYIYIYIYIHTHYDYNNKSVDEKRKAYAKLSKYLQ